MDKNTWTKEFITEYKSAQAEGRPVVWHGDLTGADLTGTGLCGADLRRADLRGADLSGANLTWAKLSGAKLSEADLRRADLRGADLTWANLTGANLSEAKGIWYAIPGESDGRGCVFVLWKDGVHVFTGCFSGTIDKFLSDVEEKHGDSKWGRYYRSLAETAKIALEDK